MQQISRESFDSAMRELEEMRAAKRKKTGWPDAMFVLVSETMANGFSRAEGKITWPELAEFLYNKGWTERKLTGEAMRLRFATEKKRRGNFNA